MTLADFQHAFWRDLWAAEPTPGSPWAAQAGFAVYRNTVLKGCVDNLLALFPAVRRLTGDTWFSAVALAYAREHPPLNGCMAHYGQGLPEHLAHNLPVGELPWLPEVAWLDVLWSQCHTAADAPLLTPETVMALDATALAHTRLVPHPATRWRVCANWPAHSLWQAAREAWPDPNPATWAGQCTLLTRPHGVVLALECGLGTCALLDACARGEPVGAAVAGALATEPGLDLAATLGHLIANGAFTAVSS